MTWRIPVDGGAPQKLSDASINREKDLETWIQAEPGLVEPGLTVLARQLMTDGGPLDLLGLDAEGRLVIVELKRSEAYREAAAQALDYAACVAGWSYEDLKERVDENRPKNALGGTLDETLEKVLGEEEAENWTPGGSRPRLLIVGTGANASLRRVVDYLTAYDVPINGVFLDVSESSGGLLVTRSAVFADEQAAQQGKRRGRGGLTPEELMNLAIARGVAAFVEPVLDAWKAATGRVGRAEPKKYWSLACKSKGTKVAARLYPYNDDEYETDDKPVAWFEVERSALAEELKCGEDDLQKRLGGLPLTSTTRPSRSLIELSSQASAKKLAEAIKAWNPGG